MVDLRQKTVEELGLLMPGFDPGDINRHHAVLAEITRRQLITKQQTHKNLLQLQRNVQLMRPSKQPVMRGAMQNTCFGQLFSPPLLPSFLWSRPFSQISDTSRTIPSPEIITDCGTMTSKRPDVVQQF